MEPVKEHRFVVVFRAPGLGGNVKDTDPQATGVPPLYPVAEDQASQKTAEVAKEFLRQAKEILKGHPKAIFHTMRGFANKPNLLPLMKSMDCEPQPLRSILCTKVWRALVGMNIVGKATTLEEQMEVLKGAWSDYDFFFIHFKYTDSTGEDGNFAEKVQRIEELDAAMPAITALKPDVLIVTEITQPQVI